MNETAFGFGQPDGSIIQMAYVVPDLEKAARLWTDHFRAGPWFLLERFAGLEPVYRGEVAMARCDILLGFVGHMQIELIRLCDTHPSVYKETIERAGYGFHHWGVAACSFDEEAERQRARGYDLAFSDRVPSGGRIAYFDTRGTLPGFVELIEADAAMDEFFTAIYRASIGWDGSNLIRSASAV